MGNFSGKAVWRRAPLVCVLFASIVGFAASAPALAQSNPLPQKTPPAIGTLKSISANQLVLSTDSGTEVKVQLPGDLKVLRVPPGSKDLKEATAIALTDLQPGDRVLVRMKPADDGSSMIATTLIAMKKADIADKNAKEREEWQRHGIGGLVKNVDVGNGVITLGTLSAMGPKDVAIRVRKETMLRRYAPGSVKFDDAKAAPITEIRPGDQLRARGTRSADGSEFSADEIVSGSFRNIAGTISAVDAVAGTLTVADIATKKPVELRITPESQMRKLEQPMAQRIAMRLKGEAGPAHGGASATVPATQTGTPPSATGGQAGGSASGSGPAAGLPRSGAGGDMQQMLSRLPASPLNDFQKGDVVMIVASSNELGDRATVITLLGGVEPILQASTQGQAASILTPWTLNQGGGGDTGTP